MKRILSLSLACLCGIMVAQAEPALFGDNLQWELCGTTLSITSPDPTQPASMTFSDGIPWEAAAATITAVELPDNLTDIGLMAFSGCSALASIELPNITLIKDFAFQECIGLTEITLPSSLLEIKSYAFYGCSSLAKVTCLATTPPALSANDVFAGCDASLAICVPNETALAQYRKADNWKTQYYDELQVCGETPTGMDNAEGRKDEWTKVLRDGQLLLLRGNKT